MRSGFSSQRLIQRMLAATLVCGACGWLSIAAAQTELPGPAGQWPVATIQTDSSAIAESRYLYVGKGETWQDVRFAAQYQVSANMLASVRLNGELLFSQVLTEQAERGELQFDLPVLPPGFHRLDFTFSQHGTPGQAADAPVDYCAADVEDTVVLRQAQVHYRVERAQGLRIQQLPDALYNPHTPRAQAYVGAVQLDTRNPAELTAAARLASSWPAAAGVHWRSAAQPQAAGAQFALVLEQASGLAAPAVIHLEAPTGPTTAPGAWQSALVAPAPQAPQWPVLRIQYRDADGLEQAVLALLNPDYRMQLDTAQATIAEPVVAPHWAGLRAFATLADLGLQDIRLDGGSQALQWAFPGVWQPTDILQGQLALQAQQGLLPGSGLRIWIDGALAGSIAFNQPASHQGAHTISFQSPRPGDATSFDVRLEAALVTNGDCLPRTRGALWIDAARSQVTLPHHIKSGVAGLSAALVPQPSIRVDGSPGALDLAIALLQTSSAMLLDGRPLPARIVTDAGAEHVVVVNVDADLYRQRIAIHADRIYAPYAQDGVLLLQEERHFRVMAETPESVSHFLQHWPQSQARLPDGAREVLLAQDGDLIVLSRDVASTTVTPAMRPSTITALGALVLALLLLAIVWWLLRSRRRREPA